MKFLIADDELLARITVMKALNDLGIQNEDIYQADCGSKMLSILRENPVNIAFVDIKMPDISGLDVIKQCLSSAPSTSFYILTGYGRFEYATQAIRLGVKDFLLKPLDTQTLVNILHRERALIETENSNIRNSYADKIKSILLGETIPANFDNLYCIPCFCTYKSSTAPHLEILYQVESMYVALKTVIVPMSDCSYIAFCTSLPQYATAILSDIRNLLKQSLSQQGDACLSLFYQSDFVPFSQAGSAFENLKAYSSIRVLHGIGRLYTYNEKFTFQDKDSRLSDLFCTFKHQYDMNSYIECSHTTAEILTEMNNLDIYGNRAIMQNINRYLAATLPAPHTQLITSADFTDYLQALTDSLLNKTKNEELDIRQILAYVQQHFAEDISINALALEFHVSPNYLSSRFRRETDVRFTDYLTNLRMTRATQLLAETNLQVKEIASSVGYYTASHFIRIFVKTKGITPAEYRNQVRCENKP